MKLHEALEIRAGDVVAFAGAGGKSGAIIGVSAEFAGEGARVLVVPTTKMFLEEAAKIGPVLTSENLSELRDRVGEAFGVSRAVVAGSTLLSKERVGGVEPSWVDELRTLADVVLVEADGARRRLIKGTAEHEPVLPGSVTLTVAVGNVEALGKPVDERYVHRPEIFSELTGVGAGHTITASAFARALAQGSLGRVPEGCRKAVLITGVRPGLVMSDASLIARELWGMGVKNVVLTSLPQEEPVQVWTL
ncbi:MAG: putative selenium-dependent hydroxylase accessory protein YqeC [Rubrobacteraceae bacterium]|uniref:selenium cofactor biosynthesis protein YqeC n=1 Tax=Rubrobacter naiadicus TaxID=1392641 RepID=UPI00235EB887|nr:selenium cofactor biosynthesis protein YqeC [Rubrobacter naiadicus]MBX6762871.1 putative selenium-dependent hydroxylase accessory protein YqeC [Rubrobacteraceae bacterium]